MTNPNPNPDPDPNPDPTPNPNPDPDSDPDPNPNPNPSPNPTVTLTLTLTRFSQIEGTVRAKARRQGSYSLENGRYVNKAVRDHIYSLRKQWGVQWK